jgi:acetyl-CoA carboxylase biotin carboxyl carrier protein
MPAKKAPAGPAADADVELIRNLADILNATGLSEIELDRKGTRLRVSKAMAAAATVVHAAASAPVHHAPLAQAQHAAAEAPRPAAADHPGTVKSPMVGTCYRAPSPGAANFVEIGSEVKEGQIILIIEAMKTMNQILAPRAGKITRVFVDNAQPVEFGEALAVIE